MDRRALTLPRAALYALFEASLRPKRRGGHGRRSIAPPTS